MKRIWQKAKKLTRESRYVLIATTCLLLAAPAFAQQGNSPWENAVNVLETAFTSTIARGLSLVAIVVSGPDVRLRRRRLEARPRRRALRRRHGHRRRELPGLAFSRHLNHALSRGGATWRKHRRVNMVHRSLSRPLTILGAERKLFFFAMCVGAGTFNLLDSLLGGVLMFLLLYFFARWATQDRPADSAVPAHCRETSHAIRPGEIQPDLDPQG